MSSRRLMRREDRVAVLWQKRGAAAGDFFDDGITGDAAAAMQTVVAGQLSSLVKTGAVGQPRLRPEANVVQTL
jgi:hypothetical protein